MNHRRELIESTCYSESTRMNMYLFIILRGKEESRIMVQEIRVKVEQNCLLAGTVG